MASQHLAPAVVEFVSEHVASLDELELLMLLIVSAGRWWDASSASRELGMAADRSRALLDSFARRNLLDIRITEDVRYQFRPGTPALEQAALALAAAYQRNPAPIVQMVARAAPRSVRDFADAFRIRRRERR